MDVLNETIFHLKSVNDTSHEKRGEESPIQFFAHIEFGQPGKDCFNFGICKITAAHNILKKGYPRPCRGCKNSKPFLTKIFYTNRHELTMIFPITKMGKACRQKHFSSDYFQVDERYSSPFQVHPEGKIRLLEIKPGKYWITKTEETYTVTFY